MGRYSDEVLRQGEAFEDSPERAQARLAEALAVLKDVSQALRESWVYRGLPASDRPAIVDLIVSEALAKTDALLARGGK